MLKSLSWGGRDTTDASAGGGSMHCPGGGGGGGTFAILGIHRVYGLNNGIAHYIVH